MKLIAKGREAFLLFTLAILSGCAFTTAQVDLAYISQSRSPMGTMKPLTLALQVEDQRVAGERSWVGSKKNGWGMVTAWVKSNKEVTTVIYDALKSELVNNGHRIVARKEDPSDVVIQIGLKRYWSDTAIHFWDVEVNGIINADVQIRNPRTDSILFSKPIGGTYRESRQIVTDGAYESVLNGALNEFIRSFSRDPSIIKALQHTQ